MQTSVSSCLDVLASARQRSERIECLQLRLPPDAICARLLACLKRNEPQLIESALAAAALVPRVGDALLLRRFYGALAHALRSDSLASLFTLVDENRSDRTTVLFSIACATLAGRLSSSGRASPAATGFCAILTAGLAQRGRDVFGAARPTNASAARSEALTGLMTTLRSYDPTLHEQARAVSALAARIGARLGLDRDAVAHLSDCALLRDIGMVGVSRALLSTSAKLTRDELGAVRQHAILGAQILTQFTALSACAPVVRAHHEQVDGSGYPDGLRGNDIPFAARIIAVADAFYEMTQPSPSREALSAHEALAGIRNGRGSQFDALVVDAFCELVGSRTDRGNVPAIGARA